MWTSTFIPIHSNFLTVIVSLFYSTTSVNYSIRISEIAACVFLTSESDGYWCCIDFIELWSPLKTMYYTWIFPRRFVCNDFLCVYRFIGLRIPITEIKSRVINQDLFLLVAGPVRQTLPSISCWNNYYLNGEYIILVTSLFNCPFSVV